MADDLGFGTRADWKSRRGDSIRIPKVQPRKGAFAHCPRSAAFTPQKAPCAGVAPINREIPVPLIPLRRERRAPSGAVSRGARHERAQGTQRSRVGDDGTWDYFDPPRSPARSLALRSMRPFAAIPFRSSGSTLNFSQAGKMNSIPPLANEPELAKIPPSQSHRV